VDGLEVAFWSQILHNTNYLNDRSFNCLCIRVYAVVRKICYADVREKNILRYTIYLVNKIVVQQYPIICDWRNKLCKNKNDNNTIMFVILFSLLYDVMNKHTNIKRINTF